MVHAAGTAADGGGGAQVVVAVHAGQVAVNYRNNRHKTSFILVYTVHTTTSRKKRTLVSGVHFPCLLLDAVQIRVDLCVWTPGRRQGKHHGAPVKVGPAARHLHFFKSAGVRDKFKVRVNYKFEYFNSGL